MTFFFFCFSELPFDNEDRILVPSPNVATYDHKPEMSAPEVCERLVAAIREDKYDFIVVNYANGDMVGHTADMEATIVAMEAIDLSLKRIAEKVDELGGCLVVVADHGNAEELLDENGQPKTSHTLNKVPCIIYDNTSNRSKYYLSSVSEPGLKNIAATLAVLLGQNDYPESWSESLIKIG